MELLTMKNISKVFGGNQALDSIYLSINPGEVHALVGENGAGKSTLIKIMTGVYQPTSGRILWEGRPVDVSTPKEAQTLGITAIHQDRQLVPHFNGLENLFLNKKYPLKRNRIQIDWKKMKQEAEALKNSWGIDIPLDVPVSDMTPSERTLLEILRAMDAESRILILDEPTASLSDKESQLLFSFIERLRSQGVAIIYISHRLEEVIRISDRVTVLTAGKLITTLTKDQLSKEVIIHHMTDGKALNHKKKISSDQPKKRTLFQVENLRTKDGRVKQANFSLYSNEILGVYGLAGSGRTETLESIFGLRPMKTDAFYLKGEAITKPNPTMMIENGMVMISENRHEEGLIMGNSIIHNMTLPIINSISNRGKMQRNKEQNIVDKEMNRFNVKATSANQTVSELSGGNQQKVVLGKALLSNPDIYLCDEPTQAVDIMTRSEIHSFLHQQAELGKGIVFVSSDLNEILEVSDRVLLFSEGETVAELENKQLSPSQILNICYHYNRTEGVSE
ncbi:sugar ABC transporter ATP-binding protein [Aquibacillus albus]|uniref:Ribose transport system ATP-binding protein n=1 Tax=Aquibacillus albus TaxID=1168171 RepID=A0ABS2N6H2_9BACI|nr:sugar ABC transporter ATP-binding protein [Aquibacillus albus]MBM7573732.1 ribose transport system ATP-binding protein [Aquibacillus albus]